MLTLNYANCLSDRVGAHGLDAGTLGPTSDAAKDAARLTKSLAGSRGKGWERWRDLPFDPARSEHLDAVNAVVRKKRGKCDNLVVLGIGGSALGNIALHASLKPATYNLLSRKKRGGPRLFVVDNVDPAYFGSIIRFIREEDPDLERTVFNVVSKSGETAETAAQFITIRKLLIDTLGKKKHGKQIVAITDPAHGTMRKICDAEGYTTLPVPDGVGGRFSVLSPVGLFSAAMCGIDIAALLDGAAAMDQRCRSEKLAQNPAAMLATVLVRLGREKGKVNHVMMPYSNGLYLLADWYRQLWAESLGKAQSLDGKTVYAGFTPIKALGTTDQHSQVQLYREGPNDKVFCLVSVDEWGKHDVKIPTGFEVEPILYLQGSTFASLIAAEKRATEYALVESERPNLTIAFPRVDETAVGEFIALWEIATAYAGLMLNVDAYNQPAVETGKVATFGLMGRAGYDEWKDRVDKALAPTAHTI